MTTLVVYLFSVFVFGVIVSLSRDERIKKIYLAIVFLFAFFYSAFRAPIVGADTDSYYRIYNNIQTNGLAELPRNTEIEKGFMILCFLLGKITSNPQAIIILMSAVVSFAFYYFIKKTSKNYMVSSLIFVSMFFMATMNISRQFFAHSLILFAILFALDKKPVKTAAMLLIAASMHYSALVFLPLILLSFPAVKLKPKTTLLLCIISGLAIPVYSVLVSFVVSIFPQYERFLSSATFSSETGVSVTFVVFLVFVTLLNLWANNKKKECNEESDRERIINNLFTILLIDYIVAYIISSKMMIAGRLVYYFQISLLVVIPEIVNKIVQMKTQKVLGLLAVVSICGLFLKYGCDYFANDPHGILPYATVLDERWKNER